MIEARNDSPINNLSAKLAEMCDGSEPLNGATAAGVMFLCLRPNARLTSTAHRELLEIVIAHEIMHLMQFQVVGLPPRYTRGRAWPTGVMPVWLIEGSAQTYSYSAVWGAKVTHIRPPMIDLFAQRDIPDLADLEQRTALEADRTGVYIAGGIAVTYLVEEFGFRALGRLFTALGDGRPFDQAFQTTFNQPLSEFYAGFQLRVRPVAANSGGQGGQSPRASAGAAQPAADPARCVQAQLNATGFNAGPVDGQIGPRTQAALSAYRESHGMTDGIVLNVANAPAWCARIGTQNSQLRRHWPAFGARMTMTLSPSLDPAFGTWLSARFEQIHRRATARMQIFVSSTDALLVGNSAAELRQLVAAHPGVDPSPEFEAWLTQTCEPSRYPQAFAMPGVAVLCLTNSIRPTRTETRGELETVMAQAIVQLVRWQVGGVAADDTTRVVTEGPAWLHEGYGFLFARSITSSTYFGSLFRAPIFRRFAGRDLPDLRQFETRDALMTSAAGDLREGGAMAASFLVDTHGDVAFGRYFTALGANIPSETAFETAFGQSLDAFYTEFAQTVRP
jgi:hypothetical protein